MGKRNEYEHGLAEDLVPFMFGHEFDCPAVVQAVRQLDQHDSDIVIQGKQDAFEIFCLHTLLHCLILIVKHCLDLSQSIHKSSDFVSEKFAEVIDSIVGIFDDIMEKGGYNGLVAKADVVDHNLRHRNGVQDVWLAGTPSDALVRFISKLECLLDDVEFVGVGAPFACGLLEVCILSCYDFIVLTCKYRYFAHMLIFNIIFVYILERIG